MLAVFLALFYPIFLTSIAVGPVFITISSIGLTYGLKCYLLSNKLLLTTFLNRGYNITIDHDSYEISFTYNIFPSLLSDKLPYFLE